MTHSNNVECPRQGRHMSTRINMQGRLVAESGIVYISFKKVIIIRFNLGIFP